MLSELAYEQIEGNFWYAEYGLFRVVMMKDIGYINASEMCSSNGKEYSDWAHENQDLINALRSMMDNEHDTSPTSIFVEPGDTPNKKLISGTYCHPDLIPHIACWASGSFALVFNRIVNNYFGLDTWLVLW